MDDANSKLPDPPPLPSFENLIALPSSIQSSADLASVLEASPYSVYRIKLYDCHVGATEEALTARSIQKRTDDVGFAIICVLLSQYQEVRNVLESGDGHGLTSITSSGKIRRSEALKRWNQGVLIAPDAVNAVRVAGAIARSLWTEWQHRVRSDA